jgi:hypothetical protein
MIEYPYSHPGAAPISSGGTFMDWPSTPDERGQAPTLLSLIETRGPEAAQAGYLVLASETLKQKNCECACQVVLRSDQHGVFTAPALAISKDAAYVVFTHWGPWDDDVYRRLLHWIECIRSCPRLGGAPIMLIYSDEPTALNRDIGEQYGVFFHRIPWEGLGPRAKPAQEPEPKIYVFVDDRGYKGGVPWEQAAHARLMALKEKVIDVDCSGLLEITSRPNKSFDPQKIAEDPTAFQYYPKLLELRYADGFDFEKKLKVATNLHVMVFEAIGCKSGVGVSNPR